MGTAPAVGSGAIDLTNVANLSFNKLHTGAVQADGNSATDFGINMQANAVLKYLDVAPGGLDAQITLKTNDGASSVDFDTGDSTPGENAYINTDIDWSARTSANDRYVTFDLEFFTDLDTTPVAQSVTGLKFSLYDLDNLQLFSVTAVNSQQAPSYVLATETIISGSKTSNTLQFLTPDLPTRSSSNVNYSPPDNDPATYRSSFSQGRVSFTFPVAVEKFTFAYGLSKQETGTSGASYALDFGTGLDWGQRAMDAPVTVTFAQAPTPQDTVIFEANGGSGSMANQRAATTTALTTNAFTRTGYTFSGWATSSNGSVVYADGDNFAFTAGTDITPLYAIWTAVQQQSSSTVTFDANGGTGTMSTQAASSATNLTANTFTKSGQIFAGWNTQSNGSGTAYADGASFPFSANATLYAQWKTPAPFEGPIPMNPSTIPAETSTEATLTGERLNLITGATVNGKPVTLKPISSTTKGLVFPALPAGTYDVIFTYQGGGTITQQAGLRVTPSSAVAAPQPGQFTAQRLFANYRGDRGPVIARDRAAITAFINQYKGITTVRCVGSTSGVPAKSTDPALAQARAKNACDIVKRLVPNATISLETSTGKGIGQRFRSVTIFISGTN